MNRLFLASIASITLALAAGCAAEEPSSVGEDDLTEVQSKNVAGFDLDGFTTGETPSEAEVCLAAVVDEVTMACLGAGGMPTSILGCRSLCDVPLTRDGQVTGFDFTGLVVEELHDTPQICTQVVDTVPVFCAAAGGKTVKRDCGSLCSVPIAPEGSVAGYDFTGPRVLEASDSSACPRMITAEESACTDVGGTILRASECRSLCSAPIAHN